MTHKGRVREGNTVTHLVKGNDHFRSFYLYFFCELWLSCVGE